MRTEDLAAEKLRELMADDFPCGATEHIARAFFKWALEEAIYIVRNQPASKAPDIIRALATQIGGDDGK